MWLTQGFFFCEVFVYLQWNYLDNSPTKKAKPPKQEEQKLTQKNIDAFYAHLTEEQLEYFDQITNPGKTLTK